MPSIATATTTQIAHAGKSMHIAYACRGSVRLPRCALRCRSMSIEQIIDDAGLASLLADARAEGRCALDTEFQRVACGDLGLCVG